METRTFAQTVLFATSLEEKLRAADALTDDEPGASLGTPAMPGRPVDLRLRKDGVRARFPAADKLVDEEQRGRLLHFFANHELLATELMALVLLKFPEAPKAFRRGIVRTLQEEQLHTSWYLRRMEACGVRFGDFPLNRFFWDAIAPMESPLDYVTRLSLTFEQANLDYSRHYAALMKQAGDTETADILDRIYRDEIAHVGYGLKWFRRWKEAGTSDWEAYKRRLPFPLSPARGRGTVAFNRKGRQEAGLEPGFIQEIEIFSQSRGRTPHVLIFHADAEAAMAYGMEANGYEPRKTVRPITEDLEILPAFFGHRDDVLLMRRPASAEHRRKLHDAGLYLPEIEPLNDAGELPAESSLHDRKLNDLRPWAWCPQSAAVLAPLANERAPLQWRAEIRQLFAKDWQMKHLEMEGQICCDPAEIEAAARDYKAAGHDEAVLKAPFGAAAQRNRRFSTASPETIFSWAESIIEQQDAVVIEPWFQRRCDFSVHFDMTDRGLKRVAFVKMENDARGQFQAAVARTKFCRGFASPIARFLMEHGLAAYETAVPERLEPLLRRANYIGPVGIDAFVYETAAHRLALRAVVEMNPRFTMGRVAWELRRRVSPGRTVRLELKRSREPETLIQELETDPPDMQDGRMKAGKLVLNEPNQILAVLTVGE